MGALDGGLNNEVGELWDSARWVQASMSILLLCINIRALFFVNLQELMQQDSWFDQRGDSEHLLTNRAVLQGFRWSSRSPKVIRADALVAIIEMLLFAFLVCRLLVRMRTAIGASHAVIRWSAVQSFFWEDLAQLATTSGMKLLYYVTPQVFIRSLMMVIRDRKATDRRLCCVLLSFLLSRVVIGILGFDLFVCKFQFTGQSARVTRGWERTVVFVGFLNQTLGVVDLSWFLVKRLIHFAFAGEDGALQREEAIREQIFHSLLARKIFQLFPNTRGVALMLSYSEKDFQKLLLNDRREVEKTETGLEPSPLQSHIDPHAAWSAHCETPHLFSRVEIAIDGGLSNEVVDLWTSTRWIFAFGAFFCMIMNAYALSVSNVKLLCNNPWIVRPTDSDVMFLNVILDYLGSFMYLSDSDDHVTIASSVVIAAFELVMFAGLGCQILLALRRGNRRGQHPFRRWTAVQRLFWEILPELSGASGLKCLYFVRPQVLGPDFSRHIRHVRAGGHRAIFPLVLFLVFRVLCVVIGFDVYVSKFQTTQRDFTRTGSLYSLVVFLNQVLGVVEINWFVKQRLMVFIFGGQDGVMQVEEEIRSMVFSALLARNIFKLFPGPRGVALMMTYSDQDFQKLVLNDHIPGDHHEHRVDPAEMEMRVVRKSSFE